MDVASIFANARQKMKKIKKYAKKKKQVLQYKGKTKNKKDDDLMKQHVARFPELKNEHLNRVTNSITEPKYFEHK